MYLDGTRGLTWVTQDGLSEDSVFELRQELSLGMIPGSEQSRGRLGLEELRKNVGNDLL